MHYPVLPRIPDVADVVSFAAFWACMSVWKPAKYITAVEAESKIIFLEMTPEFPEFDARPNSNENESKQRKDFPGKKQLIAQVAKEQ